MFINCHTYFSFRYGTFSPEELVEAGAKAGAKTLVLTDINNTSCAGTFIALCRERNIKPVMGIEFREEGQFLYLGIAKNREGWRELNEFLTFHSLQDKALPARSPRFLHAAIVYPAHSPVLRSSHPSADDAIIRLRNHEYVGIRRSGINRLYRSPLLQQKEKLLVHHPITFPDLAGYKIHKLLRCIDLNIILSRLTEAEIAASDEIPLPLDNLYADFRKYPFLISNTERLLEECEIELPVGDHNNRQTFTGSAKDDFILLKKLALSGCERRYGRSHTNAFERVNRELEVIGKLGFCAYFLITWDIVRYGHSAGYYHVGRGSGANSIVAFCLYITDVDPLELDLYFERFINPHRSSPPDFDIDFSWDERDDVTDYIFKRYGPAHTALLATYNTFKGRSIIRELGKVVGLPKYDIDTIVNEPLATQKHHHYAKHIFRYGKALEGFPNHLSIHAGGIVISEQPLAYHTALQMMPKGFPIAHFDMYQGEDLGYHKFDVLSQRGLGHIKEAVQLVKSNQGKAVDVHDIDRIKKDPQVKEMLRSGHCIGCFYIESPAMRGLLSKLKCDNYVHLVAASSIIRPGVAKSGMMREYIKRFHHPGSFEYLHPVFEEHLGETFGVMVYQEDVMKIVHHFAGLGLDESDVLRRIMTGKKKSSDTFRKLQQKYIRNCRQRGYPPELIDEVWRQVESFSGYSFCKAHSASFAVESFQSLYLKTYFPLEFMVAVINNFGGFYTTELYVHEARMLGATIHPPCVQHSTLLTNISGADVYLGFIHIRSLEQKVAEAIVNNRKKEGLFCSFADFVRRIPIGTEQLELLIRINAFRFTGMNKYELMWEKNSLYRPALHEINAATLFTPEPHPFEMPDLKEGPHDQAFDEIELLGFPLCSPFELLATQIRGDIPAKDLKNYTGKRIRMIGYYVTVKYVTTVNRKLMNFGTWLDSEGRFFDTTHFPPSLERSPFKGKGLYLIHGKVVEDFGFPSIEVGKMEKLPFVHDERYG